MLARRLLRAGGGSGGFSPPAGEDMLVAFLTRLSNKVIADDTHFPFDHARVLETAYFTWTAVETDPLVCAAQGWYDMQLNVTSLGTDYGGANNQNWIAFIGRNGLTLADFVVAGRHQAGFTQSADFFEISGTVWLEVGDEIHVGFENTNAANILIESNPSDGVPSGYLTDAGPGTLSPHLIIKTVSGPAPV